MYAIKKSSLVTKVIHSTGLLFGSIEQSAAMRAGRMPKGLVAFLIRRHKPGFSLRPLRSSVIAVKKFEARVGPGFEIAIEWVAELYQGLS